jgi:hypothetical protein
MLAVLPAATVQENSAVLLPFLSPENPHAYPISPSMAWRTDFSPHLSYHA